MAEGAECVKDGGLESRSKPSRNPNGTRKGAPAIS
jgi:hypothetical protein